MEIIHKLPSPEQLQANLFLSEFAIEDKAARDAEIASILAYDTCSNAAPPKLLMLVGPCSAHCPDAVLEYVEKLAKTAQDVKEKIIIIPRVYTAKPRSSSKGYMGLVHQNGGLFAARKLHLDIVKDYGLSCADEMLYPGLIPYFIDLISYYAVGARSVSNQEHRLTASALNIPVGMKNPISGDLSEMRAAVSAARSPQEFIFCNNFVRTKGNPLAHAVLRGTPQGANYEESGKLDMAVIVDASHGNSGKDPQNQKKVALSAIKCPNVRGIMIESFTYENQSVTDPCLTWEQTHALIHEIADRL